MLQVRDAGNLLTRAGLMIPSVDVDEVTVNYDTIDSLVHHLRWVHLPHPMIGPHRSVQRSQPLIWYMSATHQNYKGRSFQIRDQACYLCLKRLYQIALKRPSVITCTGCGMNAKLT